MKRQIMGLLLGALMATGSQAQTDKEKGNEIVPWNNPITERFGYANSVRKNNSTRWTVPNSLIRTDLVEVWGVGGSLIFNKKSVRYVDWAIPAQYERVSREFSEGLSGVVLNGRMGFIDRHNRFLIPPRFEETEELHGFSQGLAAIRIGGKYGFINKRGEIVIEPIYEWADNFRDNLLASVKMDGKFGAIDLTGQLVVPCEYKLEEAMINIPISNKAYRNAAKEVEAKKENGEYAPTLNAIQEAANEIFGMLDMDDTLGVDDLEYMYGLYFPHLTKEHFIQIYQAYHDLRQDDLSEKSEDYNEEQQDFRNPEFLHQTASFTNGFIRKTDFSDKGTSGKCGFVKESQKQENLG